MVRHSAWLGAAPERANSDSSQSPIKTRLQQMRDSASDESFEPDMPPAGDAEYLLGHFWSIGPTMGDAPITNCEMRDYQANMGVLLSPWECRTLRRLSIDYLNESHRATKRDSPPPFGETTDAGRLKQAEIQRKIDTFLN